MDREEEYRKELRMADLAFRRGLYEMARMHQARAAVQLQLIVNGKVKNKRSYDDEIQG